LLSAGCGAKLQLLEVDIMKKIERITKNVEKSKELMAGLKKVDMPVERFISDAQTYITAVRDRRISYTVDTVSKSGMSRTLIITSCERSRWEGKVSYHYRQYNTMLQAMGYSVKRGYRDSIRVQGCGMNMIFATNYNIVWTLHRLGFISRKQCDVLCQAVN
jgi:hypothetical protein